MAAFGCLFVNFYCYNFLAKCPSSDSFYFLITSGFVQVWGYSNDFSLNYYCLILSVNSMFDIYVQSAFFYSWYAWDRNELFHNFLSFRFCVFCKNLILCFMLRFSQWTFSLDYSYFLNWIFGFTSDSVEDSYCLKSYKSIWRLFYKF